MRRNVLLVLWLVSDLLLFVGAYALAYFLRVGFILSSDFPFGQFISAAALVAPFWLAILIGTRTFALMRRQLGMRTLAYIVFAGVVGAATFSLTYYFLYGEFFSRGLLLLALVFSVAFIWVWHLFFGFLSRRMMRGTTPVYPTLIVGATREATSLIKSLRENESPLMPVAILDGKGVKEAEIEGVPVAGKLNKLEETLTKYGITHLIQCSDLEQSINLLSACRNRGITYMLLPSVLGIVERDERVESLEGRPVTVVRPPESPLHWFFS